jgi:F0F1-type ATP synthase assembly protein I
MSETSRMPWIAKALSGATIGALVGMYISNTFFNERAIWLIILLTIVGAVAGVLFFGK